MVRVLVFGFAFLLPLLLKSQSTSENDSLYLIAFEKYAIQIDSFYLKYGGDEDRYAKIYLETTDLFDSIPKFVNGKEVIVLNASNFKRIYRKNNNRLIHLKIFPMEIKEGQIEITFTPYHGELKRRKNLNLALSDWTNVYFSFDCENNSWYYDRTENGGI
jgi:hypothetical protein